MANSPTFVKTRSDTIWFWGKHVVQAMLNNPKRRIEALFCTSDESLPHTHLSCPVHRVTAHHLSRYLPVGAVHQGIALKAFPLADLADDAIAPEKGHVLVLDTIVDPHNVGALWRTAAVFGLQAVIMTKDRAPDINGTVAKAACGATEIVPFVRVTNLVRTLERLQKKGFFVVGLAEQGDGMISHLPAEPIALVVGAEESGLRRLTRETCDTIVHIPTSDSFSTLNASVAGAIAMHCLPPFSSIASRLST